MSALASVALPLGGTVGGGGIAPPEIDWVATAPMWVVAAVAIVSVTLEAALPRGRRRAAQVVVSVGGLVAALVALVLTWSDEAVVTASGSIAIDGVTRFLMATVLVLAILGVLLFDDRVDDEPGFAAQASAVPGSPGEAAARRAGLEQTEVFPLLLFVVLGMLVFPAANDLLTMFVALEVLSLPLYLLCGFARRRRLLSQEAAVKYFLLGAFSSAFFLFGAALLYGFAGSIALADIRTAVQTVTGQEELLVLGFGLLVIGLLFKVGSAPFHSWTPDVYQGAPTAVVAFMAAATKVAAFGALLRVLYVAFPDNRWDWLPVLWAVAITTMVLGTVVAVIQQDIKRVLAYSSVAHAGFILTGVLALDTAGVSGSLFYLAAYGVTTIGAFAALTLVRDAGGESTTIRSWAGVGRRSPVFAAMFSLFLLALAGIPLTSGFVGKVAVFGAAIAGGAEVLAVVGVLTSAVAVVFYVRIIVSMYFADAGDDTARVATPSAALTGVLAVAAAVTVLLGVLPTPLLGLAEQSGFFAL
ncbi:NADH-quinone oxidoreductase subunit NuoN [Aquipuribacter nitratireducens]|uniref:NADH-quinone oxidoreductase subunit N n=1 Tax=Aquipuribacter nitratireducens TaxID=650104 RepID=A0ABW0GLM4_9MICO